ncbi:MAG: alpha/beta fold hydrolase [Gammaproteobacteria bacterium]
MPYVKTDAIEIYYEEEGSGDPVVLIGGLTSTVETWGMQRPALAERYRVVLPDNRGSGRTRVPNDDGARSMEGFADDVLALVDGLELDRIHLVGASMGGMIVQAFALAHPERLRSLVLACTLFGGPQAVRADPTVTARLLEATGDNADASLGVVAHPETSTKRPEAIRFYLAGKEAQPHSAEEVAARAQAVAAFDVADRVKDITVPTLVMTGKQDILVPPENSRMLAERIPNAELVEIDQAGHIFFCEQPEAVNEALLTFLSARSSPLAR